MCWFPHREEERLLIVAHHLVIDGVSWRILLEEVERCRGREEEPEEKTNSYREWGGWLEKYAESGELRGELKYWRSQGAEGVAEIGRKEGGENTERYTRTVGVSLDEERTRRLTQEAGSRWGASMHEMLLSGVGEGLRRWRGEAKWRLQMEGHGREVGVSGLGGARTMGWFTSLYA